MAADTADRPAAAVTVDRLLVAVDLLATADLLGADLRAAADMADLPADLRLVDMADLLPAEHLRDTAGLLVTADLRARRACTRRKATADRWAPVATCLR